MTPRTIAKIIAGGRLAFGAACLVAPKLVLGPTARRAEGQMVWMIRAFGVRDMCLGAGTLYALDNTEPASGRLWVAVGAAADTADVINAGVFGKELGKQGAAPTLALALPAAVGGWWAARGLAAE